ncbi:hypothetical protein RJT34_24999 [Clitoria ternatea]|uniref:Uncharacterized protein n=1 Tax=Clitoria ternatea TaxID=43366 RepID=A0AAN9IGG6_CLITE
MVSPSHATSFIFLGFTSRALKATYPRCRPRLKARNLRVVDVCSWGLLCSTVVVRAPSFLSLSKSSHRRSCALLKVRSSYSIARCCIGTTDSNFTSSSLLLATKPHHHHVFTTFLSNGREHLHLCLPHHLFLQASPSSSLCHHHLSSPRSSIIPLVYAAQLKFVFLYSTLSNCHKRMTLLAMYAEVKIYERILNFDLRLPSYWCVKFSLGTFRD